MGAMLSTGSSMCCNIREFGFMRGRIGIFASTLPEIPAVFDGYSCTSGWLMSWLRPMLACIASVAVLAFAAASAQDWPTRPITLVVPLAAGGGSDGLIRVFAPRLSELLGQSVIVENIGGAGGMIGSARVAKAAPDGYQILLGTQGTHALNQSIYAKPLYDALRDFEPV